VTDLWRAFEPTAPTVEPSNVDWSLVTQFDMCVFAVTPPHCCWMAAKHCTLAPGLHSQAA